MSTTESQANVSAVLQPVLSDRFALKWHQFAICAWFSVFFMYLSYLPLFHSDIWCHVLYGQWILEHGALPTSDPYMPLASGMQVVDNAWASQLFFAWIHRISGPQGISTCFAVVGLSIYLIQFRVFYLMSGKKWIALLASMTSLMLVITRHAVVRPEMFGGLLFALLMLLLVHFEPWRRRSVVLRDRKSWAHPPKWIWLAIPSMFAVWANVHGSFAVGLVVLACHVAGRFFDVLIRSKSLKVIFRDTRLRYWILITEVAVLGTLLNPYGVDLLLHTASFGGNPNLKEILEWYPLKLIDLEGIQFSFAALVTIVLLRHSRQKMRAADILMLAFFTFTVATTIRMINWLAPIFALTMVPHLTDVASRFRRRRNSEDSRSQPSTDQSDEPIGAQKFVFTLLTGLMIWCAFSLSPASQPLLGSKPIPDERLYNQYTPTKITKYLREHPPKGIMYAPQWWGDWMIWDGPENIQPMVTTNVHLVPRKVWTAYLSIHAGVGNWERVLDHYGITTMVVHKELQPQLVKVVRRSAIWRIVYETELGIVLERSKAM